MNALTAVGNFFIFYFLFSWKMKAIGCLFIFSLFWVFSVQQNSVLPQNVSQYSQAEGFFQQNYFVLDDTEDNLFVFSTLLNLTTGLSSPYYVTYLTEGLFEK